jgi:hypothetical protein
MRETIKINKSEYVKLLRVNDRAIREKLLKGFERLVANSLEDCLVKLHSINKLVNELEANKKLLERHEPKFTADDIPF